MFYKNLKTYAESLECKIFENALLSKYTSFKIGGPADLLIEISNENALKNILKEIRDKNLPFFILGNGSNLLVPDEGYRGIILRLGRTFKKIKLENENTVICGAGAMLSSVCAFAKRNSLSGLEFAWGIPGSIGGAVFMNAGAYDGEIKNVCISSKHIDTNGEIAEFSGDELKFSYRHSIYKENNLIIISAKFNLQKENKEKIAEKMKNFMSKRKSKQPLEFPSAGSIFKRPPGYYAGTLIQECGLKGKQIGGAQISEKHAGFIINRGGATCKDVLDLINLVQKTIFEKTCIKMESEVRVL